MEYDYDNPCRRKAKLPGTGKSRKVGRNPRGGRRIARAEANRNALAQGAD